MRLVVVNLLLALCGASLAAGCVSEQSGTIEPGANLGAMKAFYIVRDKDGDVAKAIETDLARRGYSATAGSESAMPANAECMILFTDKWVWDITMYLLEVKVELVDPKTGALFASGRSYRTSLVRGSPEDMVREVFDRIFQPARAGE